MNRSRRMSEARRASALIDQEGGVRWRFVMMFGLCVGCGPYMRTSPVLTTQYTTQVRCAQGPFELTVQTAGGRWAETVDLDVLSQRAVHGRVRVLVDGAVVEERPFGATRSVPASTAGDPDTVVQSSGPDNAYCLEVVAPVDAVPVVEPVREDVQPAEVVRDFDPPLAPPPALEVRAQLAKAWLPTPTAPRTDIANVRLSTQGRPPGEVRLQWWSSEPNDLAGAVFVVTHTELRPSVSDAEWDQFQAERDIRRQPRRDRRNTRRNAARTRRSERDWRRTERQARNPGRQERRQARELKQRERRARVLAERRAAAVLAAANREVPPVVVQSGPPPAPVLETPGSVPTPSAVWIPGYWDWNGEIWLWSDGWWRVPASELAVAVASAPSQAPAAPPPRVESPPPQPGPTLVWTLGRWHWTGSVHVWVGGAWRTPTQQHRRTQD